MHYALRVLGRSPVYSLTTILLLSFAIAANTAIFSLIESVILRPLPYRDAGRLCVLWKTVPARNIEWDWTSLPTIRDWQNQNAAFEDMAFVLRPEGSKIMLTSSSPPERIQASTVSANFFEVLGVQPQVGQLFASGRVDLVVLSDGFWRRHFGGQPDVLGRALRLDHRSFTIAGVMPPDFQIPDKSAQLWLPIAADPRWTAFQRVRIADAFMALARLKPGVSIDQAQAAMRVISTRLHVKYPDTDATLGVRVVPLAEQIAGRSIRSALWILGGAALCVLLIVCSNLAGLQLARGMARQKEFAIRAALGASRSRLLSQLARENGLLLLASGAVGVALAYAGLPILLTVLPSGIARADAARIDGATLLFTVSLCLLAGLIVGVAPALRLIRRAPIRQHAYHIRGWFMAGQFSLAVLLLTGAGLLIHSYLLLDAVEPGFNTTHLLTMELELPESKYDTRERRTLFFDQALRRIDSLPGARAAVGDAVFDSFTSHVPNENLVIEGRARTQDIERHSRNIVSDSYFGVLGIPLRQGRLFSTQDLADGPLVAVINETMAQRYWPGQNPMAKRFQQVLPGMRAPWFTVIGVVGDAVYNRDGKIIPVFYSSYRQFPYFSGNSLVVRSAADPLSLIPAIREAIHALEPGVPFFEVSTVEQRLQQLDRPRLFQTELLGLFAAIALILAAAGLYGVLSFTVEQRTREIGIRMALGSTRIQVVQLLLRQVLLWAAGGLAAGIASSIVFARALSSALFGVTPVDPITLASVAGLLVVIAALASAQPAARAAAVDPNVALRHE